MNNREFINSELKKLVKSPYFLIAAGLSLLISTVGIYGESQENPNKPLIPIQHREGISFLIENSAVDHECLHVFGEEQTVTNVLRSAFGLPPYSRLGAEFVEPNFEYRDMVFAIESGERELYTVDQIYDMESSLEAGLDMTLMWNPIEGENCYPVLENIHFQE